MLLLAGDIGATNTRLRLVDGVSLETDREDSFLSKDYDNLTQIIQQFLGHHSQPQKAGLAIAGPVINDRCKITNLHWPEFSASQLQVELDIPQVTLINDFVAIAYNIVLEPNKQLYTLQTGQPNSQAPIAIIGAGSGLGKAFATPIGNGKYQIFPTEGGHVDIAPRHDLGARLWQYLNDLYGPKIDIERVVSGPGIVDIFSFLHDRVFPGKPVGDLLTQKDLAAAIAQAANSKTNFLAEKTMEIFIDFYGAASGDMALSFLPFGGLYLAGGIAAKNVNLIAEKKVQFLSAFTGKDRIGADLLSDIPIHIVLNQLEGLMGAIRYITQ